MAAEKPVQRADRDPHPLLVREAGAQFLEGDVGNVINGGEEKSRMRFDAPRPLVPALRPGAYVAVFEMPRHPAHRARDADAETARGRTPRQTAFNRGDHSLAKIL